MVQITGKFQLVKSENFVTHLVSLGIPEDAAKKFEQSKAIYEVKLDGDKISLDILAEQPIHIELILNKEVDEVFPSGLSIKTTSVLAGDTLTLTSKHPDGRKEIRIHKFTDSELVVTYQDDDPTTPDAVRVFKRL